MPRKHVTPKQHQWLIVTGLTAFLVTGCFRSMLLTSTAVERTNEDDIVVSMKDGRQVSFDSRQYNLGADENGQPVLRGKGKIYRQGESQFDWFEGGIPVADIERITTSEKTPMFYVTVVTATLVVGAALLLTWALHGKSLGG